MSTIIYQVHSYSVEWEDYEDIIEGSYFKKSDSVRLYVSVHYGIDG